MTTTITPPANLPIIQGRKRYRKRLVPDTPSPTGFELDAHYHYLEWLALFRALSTNHLVHLTGLHPRTVQERLGQLYDRHYVLRFDHQIQAHSKPQSLLYGLTSKGAALIREITEARIGGNGRIRNIKHAKRSSFSPMRKSGSNTRSVKLKHTLTGRQINTQKRARAECQRHFIDTNRQGS